MKYYYLDDESRKCFYSDEPVEKENLTLIGSSDNPNIALAASTFLQGQNLEAIKLTKYEEE